MTNFPTKWRANEQQGRGLSTNQIWCILYIYYRYICCNLFMQDGPLLVIRKWSYGPPTNGLGNGPLGLERVWTELNLVQACVLKAGFVSHSPRGIVMSTIYQNDTANEFEMLILVVHPEVVLLWYSRSPSITESMLLNGRQKIIHWKRTDYFNEGLAYFGFSVWVEFFLGAVVKPKKYKCLI